MANMLDQYDLGYMRMACLIWEEMIQRDDKMVVAVPKMIRRVAQRPWEILIGEDVPEALRGEAERHRDALKYFYSNLRCENVLEGNETGGLKLLIRRAMTAKLYKYMLAEIIWRPSSKGLTATARYTPLALFNTWLGKLRWSDVAYLLPGTELDLNNWMVAVSDTCMMKALSICYMFKRLPMQDALSFCQRYGIPTVHGETDMKPGSPEWNAFVDALSKMANDQAIATTLGSKVNILPAAASDGEAVFGWIIEMMNRAIVTICCGNDLSTMSAKDATGASLQANDADDLTADHCEWISETFQEQFDRRVIAEVFGADVEPLAYFRLMPPQDEDVDQEMKIDDHVTKHGVKLTPADVAERFNRVDASAQDLPGAAAKPKIPPTEDTPPVQAANEAAGMSRLEKQQFQSFVAGVQADQAPLVAALRPLVEANGADATRNALHTLSLGLDGMEDKIIAEDHATAALEVAVATDFLRALSGKE